MKRFYIQDRSNYTLIELNDPMDIIRYLKDNPHLNGCEYDINLRNSNLKGANLTGVNLSYANLRNTDLTSADLTNASLSNANLVNAGLTEAILSYANLSYANLKDANLRGADLTDTNLKNVNLFSTIGDGDRIKTLCTSKYIVNMYDDRLQIGCKNYSKQEWLKFTDKEIDKMDYYNDTLEFWNEWKPRLINMDWL